jgi:phosphohistidine swiveling domain-containing protein
MDVMALTEVGLGDAPRVGRKAAVLGGLLAAGFAVPAGWCVSAEQLEEAFGPGGDSQVLRKCLAEVVAEAGATPLAVRSSGVAEDLAGMSYAGQYESVLNRRGLDEVCAAVRICWESGLSERVAVYQGGARGTGVGVLIQEMVDADVAGVAFSVNVLTRDPDEVVVNAVGGLGEALMSGEATAEEWTFKAGTATRTRPEGVATPRQIVEVAELAKAVERWAGAPQDIEWAFHGGKLWLLQARPVTGLRGDLVPHVPIPVEIPPGTSMRDPNFDRPWTPFAGSVFLPVFTEGSPYVFAFTTGARPKPVLIGGWPYVNQQVGSAVELVAKLEEIAKRVAAGDTVRIVEQWEGGWKAEVRGDVERLRATSLSALDDAGLAAHLEAVRAAFGRHHLRYFKLTGASASLLGHLGAACAELLGWDSAKTLELRGGLEGDHVQATSLLGDLARIAARIPASRAAVERGELPEDPEFREAFAAYVDSYGHRTTGFTLTDPTLAEQPSVLLGLVRARLDVPGDLAAERERLAARREAAVAEARAALAGKTEADRERFERCLAGSDISAPVRDEKSFYAVSLWGLLRYAMLEAGRRLVEAGALRVRDDVLFLEYGEVLAALSGEVLADGAVQTRKGEYAWALAHPGPPMLGAPPTPPVPEPGMTPPTPAAVAIMAASEWTMRVFGAGASAARQEEHTLHGVAASAGHYTGSARIIRSAAEFGKLRAGEVLVCPETTAQWAMLFPSVGALVTERGSLLSHPAVLAREYGVPAVVATRSATTFFADGDLITVDGSAGTVRRETRS